MKKGIEKRRERENETKEKERKRKLLALIKTARPHRDQTGPGSWMKTQNLPVFPCPSNTLASVTNSTHPYYYSVYGSYQIP